jgi:hypothetical protein
MFDIISIYFLEYIYKGIKRSFYPILSLSEACVYTGKISQKKCHLWLAESKKRYIFATAFGKDNTTKRSS